MIRFSLATAVDDVALRTLLREPMDGWVRIAMMREPTFFSIGRDVEWAVLARDGDIPVGMYTGAQHGVHLNGAPVMAGYLGGLRVARTYRHRPHILFGGYASIETLCPLQTPPAVWYSTIAPENKIACRLLEARLPGFPRYEPCNDFITLAISRTRARLHGIWKPIVTSSELEAFCSFYNGEAGRYQFSPVLTPDAIRDIGARFFAAGKDGQFTAVMALWNRQSHRQVRICGYREPFLRFLPLYNFWARLARRVELPRVGTDLNQSFLAFFAAGESKTPFPSEERRREAPRWLALIEDALSLCETPILVFGLHAEHPALNTLCRYFRPVQYRTRVYTVSFGKPPALDNRPAQPEAAVL